MYEPEGKGEGGKVGGRRSWRVWWRVNHEKEYFHQPPDTSPSSDLRLQCSLSSPQMTRLPEVWDETEFLWNFIYWCHGPDTIKDAVVTQHPNVHCRRSKVVQDNQTLITVTLLSSYALKSHVADVWTFFRWKQVDMSEWLTLLSCCMTARQSTCFGMNAGHTCQCLRACVALGALMRKVTINKT